MYNWSTNIGKLKQKVSEEEFEIFKLNQLINFGLNGEKISIKKLRKYWDKLTIDRRRRKFLEQFI